jgi:regulatory protein
VPPKSSSDRASRRPAERVGRASSAGRAGAGRIDDAGRARAGRTDVFDSALRLLGRRAHSRAELQRKLARRGYGEEAVAQAVTRLTELGYLDDRSFAAGHVRRRSGSRGPLALSAELSVRGVDRRVADAALQAFGPEAQLAAATRIVARLAGRKSFVGYRELLDSVGAKLLRRGFSQAVAREACQAMWAGTAASPEA